MNAMTMRILQTCDEVCKEFKQTWDTWIWVNEVWQKGQWSFEDTAQGRNYVISNQGYRHRFQSKQEKSSEARHRR